MKHARTIFTVLLFLSALVTAFLGISTLINPKGMMKAFGAADTEVPGLELLMAVLGSAILSLALFVLLAAWWSWHNRREGRTLGLLGAMTMILVGLCAWGIGGSSQILLLDGIRGGALLLCGLLWKPE